MQAPLKAARVLARLCMALQPPSSELMPIASAVVQFVLHVGRPALATALAAAATGAEPSPAAQQNIWAFVEPQHSALFCFFYASISWQFDLQQLASTALQPHALLAWLATVSDALSRIDMGECQGSRRKGTKGRGGEPGHAQHPPLPAAPQATRQTWLRLTW